MNSDQIERALRQPGPREGAYQPIALPQLHADARDRHGLRGRLLTVSHVGLLTAAVVAGTAVALMLTLGNLRVPWSNGPGAGPTVSSAVASSGPAVRACHAEDFAWTTDPWTGAAGSRGTTVVARGVTSLAGCEIRGRATLVLRDANGRDLVAAEAPVSSVSVDAGTVLEIGVSWSNWCGNDPAVPLALSLTLPGDTHAVPLVASTGTIPVPPCMGIGQPALINATDFQPSDRVAPEG